MATLLLALLPLAIDERCRMPSPSKPNHNHECLSVQTTTYKGTTTKCGAVWYSPAILHEGPSVHVTDVGIEGVSLVNTQDVEATNLLLEHQYNANQQKVQNEMCVKGRVEWDKWHNTPRCTTHRRAISFSRSVRITGKRTSFPSAFLSTFPSTVGLFLASAWP